MQISQKQFLSFKVNSKSSCRLRPVVSFYLCYIQGRKTCLSTRKQSLHPVCIPKGKHTENFSNDLRPDKQNANAYLIKCATFPYCDQFRVPCLNTKHAYMQLFCPVTRFLKFSEHKSLNICMLRSESDNETLQFMFIQISFVLLYQERKALRSVCGGWVMVLVVLCCPLPYCCLSSWRIRGHGWLSWIPVIPPALNGTTKHHLCARESSTTVRSVTVSSHFPQRGFMRGFICINCSDFPFYYLD